MIKLLICRSNLSKCRSTAQIEPCESQTFNDFFFCNEPHKYFAPICPYNMMCHARNCFCVAKEKTVFAIILQC